MKAFRVDLKACLVLTNTAPSSSGKIEAGFWVILLCGPRLLLCRPYYEPLLWFMICKGQNYNHIKYSIENKKTLTGGQISKIWVLAQLRG